MSAVLEAERHTRDDWYMPTVNVGDDVLWYERGDPRMGGQRAVVERIYGRTIECRLAVLGTQKIGVRHISDPVIIKTKGRAVEDFDHGAWDYSPAAKVHREERAALIERIDRLEYQFAQLRQSLGLIDPIDDEPDNDDEQEEIEDVASKGKKKK